MKATGAKALPSQGPAPLPLRTLRKRWGKDVADMGFVSVPWVLVRFQREFELTSTELVLLLHLLAVWNEDDELPKAAHGELARRMGLTPKSVRRTLEALEARRLISRRPRHDNDGGQLENAYDLSGLLNRMSQLALQHREPSS